MIYISTEYNRHAGLGNKLFPWSRAKIYCHLNNSIMFKQKWISIRGAAVTRGGIDYSKVFSKIFLCNNFSKGVNELNKFNLCVPLIKIFPRVFVNDLKDASRFINENNIEIVFKWNTEHNFSDLQVHRLFILEELKKITLPDYKLNYLADQFIGVNIRMGNDFIEAESNEIGYKKTSIDWFVEMIKVVRIKHGNLPVYIVTDGSYRQLKKLMQLENVILTNFKTAIEDLLFLQSAKVLLGSGNSSFSAWASFLGNMPTYSSKETPFNKFDLPNSSVL
jgi:hypothetical protein